MLYSSGTLRAARDGHDWIPAALTAGAAVSNWVRASRDMVSLCELARPSAGVVTRVAAVEAQRPWGPPGHECGRGHAPWARVGQPATRPLSFEMFASALAETLTPHPSARIIDEQS